MSQNETEPTSGRRSRPLPHVKQAALYGADAATKAKAALEILAAEVEALWNAYDALVLDLTRLEKESRRP